VTNIESPARGFAAFRAERLRLSGSLLLFLWGCASMVSIARFAGYVS